MAGDFSAAAVGFPAPSRELSDPGRLGVVTPCRAPW